MEYFPLVTVGQTTEQLKHEDLTEKTENAEYEKNEIYVYIIIKVLRV